MNIKKIISFIICVSIPLVIGSISGWLTASEIITFNATLIKPSFSPPNYLFGPVWTLIYILMGISLFFIWQSPKSSLRSKGLIVFALQLFANFMWSILFFKMQLLFVAVIDIVLMWILILSMILIFYKLKKAAAFVNIPYLLWVSFATVLNISLWYLNRG